VEHATAYAKTLDQALDVALEELRAERASGQAQRQTLERELAQVATRQERLAVAIAHGEAMTPLLDQMRREETRKAEIVAALAGLEHGLVEKVLPDLEAVRADGVASLVVVGAPVEALPAVAMGPGHGDQGPPPQPKQRPRPARRYGESRSSRHG
jgi:hypothetical protein